MPDILHDLPIKASTDRVFQMMSTPQGLNQWWTKRSSGNPAVGAEYELWFAPGYDWRAVVTRCDSDAEFEFEMTRADTDWNKTHVGISLEDRGETTWLSFHHKGWPTANEHFRTSSNCWAMYLRIMRRHLEHGESVPYEIRLDV